MPRLFAFVDFTVYARLPRILLPHVLDSPVAAARLVAFTALRLVTRLPALFAFVRVGCYTFTYVLHATFRFTFVTVPVTLVAFTLPRVPVITARVYAHAHRTRVAVWITVGGLHCIAYVYG